MIATGLKNEGRRGIAVRSIEAPPQAVVRIEPENERLRELRGRIGFEAFELPAGESRWIAVVSRVPGCDRRPRAFTSVGSIRIRFEVLGITRTTTFDLPSGSLAFGRRNGRPCSFLIPDDEPP